MELGNYADALLRSSVELLNLVLSLLIWECENNHTWGRRNSSELMNLYEDVDIISSIRLSKLRWIGHMNSVDKERKLYNNFQNQPLGTQIRGRRTRRWIYYMYFRT